MREKKRKEKSWNLAKKRSISAEKTRRSRKEKARARRKRRFWKGRKEGRENLL